MENQEKIKLKTKEEYFELQRQSLLSEIKLFKEIIEQNKGFFGSRSIVNLSRLRMKQAMNRLKKYD